MLCEECGKNQATVSITVTTGNGTKTRRLCPECMKKMEFNLVKGDIQSFLSSVLSVLGNNSKKKSESPAIVCSSCGLSFAEYEHTGRLGCAQCYRDFAQQLKPSLQKIHGRTQHAGRKPKAYIPDPHDELERQMNELRRQMDEAVAAENFEEAARLRDELRAMADAVEVKPL
ncbi:MAG: UvrB/UvrC motif-containing protein [Clostridia bacterium]|nr:UvrB/UvrC motif-containing protein [Clostridia bacterium]